MNPKPTASPTPALAQSPAAVVSPTTRLLMVTIIVPTPRKPMPLITWAAHTGDVDIGAWELIKGEFIDNHGQRGAHIDQGMGLNPCLLIFCFPVKAYDCACQRGNNETSDNGGDAP